jgi:hypothetical protein
MQPTSREAAVSGYKNIYGTLVFDSVLHQTLKTHFHFSSRERPILSQVLKLDIYKPRYAFGPVH